MWCKGKENVKSIEWQPVFGGTTFFVKGGFDLPKIAQIYAEIVLKKNLPNIDFISLRGILSSTTEFRSRTIFSKELIFSKASLEKKLEVLLNLYNIACPDKSGLVKIFA